MHFFKLICIFSGSVIFLCETILCNEENLPCSYHDSVALIDSERLENGSYLHDEIVIPSNLTAMYNHTITYGDVETSVRPHLRGCICLIRPCLNWCCKQNQRFNKGRCVDVYESVNHEVPIKISENEFVNKSLLEHFYPLYNRKPCYEDLTYPLRPLKYKEDKWHLLENGSIQYPEFNASAPKHMHCIALDVYMKNYVVTSYGCGVQSEPTLRDKIYAYVFWFSIPFMVATIVIYATIPELRTIHGKSLICYLVSLVISYLNLSYINIVGVYQIGKTSCEILGYSTYYFLIAAFLWLSVISFDLWWNFTGRKKQDRLGQRIKFLIYSGYCWGLSLVFLIILKICDVSEDFPEDYKSGIGESFCFINVYEWSAMVSFYGPALLVIIFNMTMFTLTFMKIRQVQLEMTTIMSEKENRKSLKFELFLRLFIIMGITWIMEIIAYVSGVQYESLFYITDICNALQGFLIFLFFVLKRNVLRLCQKKYDKIRGRQFSRQFSKSSQSYSSQVSTIATALPTQSPDPDIVTSKPLMNTHC